MRIGGFARRFESELLAKLGISVPGGLLQHGDGLRIELHAPVKIDCGANHTEDFGVLAVESFDISLRRSQIFAAFIQIDEGVAQLQARDRIGGQREQDAGRRDRDGW